MSTLPRAEHPRPDFFRPVWQTLNGTWQFAFDEGNKGLSEGWQAPGVALPLSIEVPFCYQCAKSGIADKRLIPVVWYRRTFSLPEAMRDRRVLLRFGAVDYHCAVYVNGERVGEHTGGYTPFAFDITRLLSNGENDLCLRCEDQADCTQPRGKQYWRDGFMGCWYTPTTGIWQSVYLEAMGDAYLSALHVTPNIDDGTARFELTLADAPRAPITAQIDISFEGQPVRSAQVSLSQRHEALAVNLIEGGLIEGFHFWSPKSPALYDVTVRLLSQGVACDEVRTYFGMRKVAVCDGWVLLNNQPLYQRLVLDQGYWPESLITPPSDDAIRADVEWTLKLGYNGARKHQKLEDPRYYYWADKLGLLVWGEVPSTYEFTAESVANLSDTLSGFIDRDYNHPSIIAWTPLNESWGVSRIYADPKMQAAARMLYQQAKALDSTRMVSVNDGWEQVETDLYGLHDYAADGETMHRHFDDLTRITRHSNDWRMACCQGFTPSGKEAILVTEYGGIALEDGAQESWGYHDKVPDTEAFFARYQSVTDAVRALPYCQGFCYTQLTDVEQETNGILTPNRTPKVDPLRFAALTRNPDGR